MMAIMMMMMMTRIFLFINIKNSILESEIFFFICLLFSIDFSQWILSAAFFWNFEISKLFKVSMAVCSILLLLLIIIDNHQKNFFFEHTLQQQIINKTGSIPINHENISILYMLRLTNKLADGVYHHQWTEIEIRLTDERKRKKNSSHSYTFFFLVIRPIRKWIPNWSTEKFSRIITIIIIVHWSKINLDTFNSVIIIIIIIMENKMTMMTNEFFFPFNSML